MGSWVIQITNNVEIFKASTTLSSQPRVTHIIQSLELFITSRALRSQSTVVHVNHNPELFIAFRALSSQPWVVHVIHNLELFITFKALGSQPRIVHIIHTPELFMSYRGLSLKDPKLFISSTTLSCSYNLEPWVNWWEKPRSLCFLSLDQDRNMHNYPKLFLNSMHSEKNNIFIL